MTQALATTTNVAALQYRDRLVASRSQARETQSPRPSPKPTPKATVRPSQQAKVAPAPKPAVSTKGCPAPPFGLKAYPKGHSCEALIYARSRLSAEQWSCLHKLWYRESGWVPTAHRPGSRYYGIPQLDGLAHGTPALKQVDRGLTYIKNRPAYGGPNGTPCRAWQHFLAEGWY